MSYMAALDHLNSLELELIPPASAAGKPAIRRKFDLAHMRVLASALGSPQEQFPSVLIAGTNGKGSTAATLASILAAAGYRTGLYTSPHLVRVNERIRVNANPAPELKEIPDEDFARHFFEVDDAARKLVDAGNLPQHPSFFETLTALAFRYFAQQKVDIAILEVGLGGRLDATNIVEPVLSVITDIALDHMDYLGTTIAEITREKAGILRHNGTLVTLPQHPEANQAIGDVAATLNLRAISAAEFMPAMSPPARGGDPAKVRGAGEEWLPRNRYTVMFEGRQVVVDSPLSGQHQQRNLALSIAAATVLSNENSIKLQFKGNHIGYNISLVQIEEGIRKTDWAGRLELLAAVRPPILLDVAHNPAGAWTLRAAVATLPESLPRTLIFSCLRDKNLTEMARILFPLFDSSSDGSRARLHDHLIFTPIDSGRAISVEELLRAAEALGVPAQAAPDAASALRLARELTPAEGLIVGTGSVYLVGELRRLASTL